MKAQKLLMNLNSVLSGEILPNHFALRRLCSSLYIQRRHLSSRVRVPCAGVPEFFEKEWTEPQSSPDLKVEFDASIDCKKFPSIIIGSSKRVELYDGSSGSSSSAQSRQEVFSDSNGENWALPARLYEPWSSLPLHLQEVNSSSSEVMEIEGKIETLLSHKSIEKEIERLVDDPVIVKKPSRKACASSRSTSDVTTVEVLLDQPIGSVRGLNKRQSNQLEKHGFYTLRKLLHHFPRTYADLQNAQNGINDGEYTISIGKIESSKGIRAGSSFGFLEVVVGCEIDTNSSPNNFGTCDDIKERKMIYLHLKKFFRGARFTSQAFLRSLQERYKIGDTACVSGKVKAMRKVDHYELTQYNIDVLEDDRGSAVCSEERPYPIYPSKGGLPPTFISTAIASALEALTVDVDPIPQEITQEFGLLSLCDAYMGIHKPKNIYQADSARKRFIFDEFFYLQLGRLFQMLEGLPTETEKNGLLDKYRKPELSTRYVENWSTLTKKFLDTLPYTLTPSQLTAASEIVWDLKRAVPMNRLLQGDVGCGKTVVAFLACMEVIGSGYQAAFMVPTELLAIQHYEHLHNLLESIDLETKPSIALLTGSTPTKQSRIIRQGLANGEISMVIGTHSLIAESVEFSSLRIAVVDEQHRFGVIQRGRFSSKLRYTTPSSRTLETQDVVNKPNVDAPMAPHVLAMTATPIPRTLALALYGDVSLTQITDLPPGRIPVDTHIIEGNDTGLEEMYKMILDELESGGKVYLVYPIIDQSEQLPQLRAATADFESISGRFPDYACGLLHGRMKSDEKEVALRRFRSGETRILLATQVIEIGVDVPDASMMVVMNAERFGIAQLHQLRGRVGRGTRKSKCVMLASGPSSCMRLKVLENSSDGYHLANMDLLLRGPGDLLGKKQSGHLPEFPIARLEIDANILQEAHLAALEILGTSHNLDLYPKLKAELSMRQPLSSLGD